MQIVKDFNSISVELAEKITPLQVGEVITFRMLNGTPNPDDEDRKKRPILYGKEQIPMSDRIKDGKRFVNIGVVTEWNNDKPARFALFVPGVGWDNYFNGNFSFTGGNVGDEEMYEYCMLTNWNKDSITGSNRDKTKAPLFELVSARADGQKQISLLDNIRRAVKYADEMDTEKMKEVLAALNIDSPDETLPEYEVVLKGKIAELARNKTDLFLETYASPDTKTKATIKSALSKSIIVHDVTNGEITMGGTVIANIKLAKGKSFIEEMSLFIKTASNGKEVLANIENQLAIKSENGTKAGIKNKETKPA